MELRSGFARSIARQARRAALVGSIVVVLACIVVAERCRPGAGRSVAVRSIRYVSRLFGIRYEVRVHPDAVGVTPAVLVANHSSGLDIPAILLARPTATFVMASELFRIPLLGAAARALGCVAVDRTHPRRAREQLAALAAAPTRDPPPRTPALEQLHRAAGCVAVDRAHPRRAREQLAALAAAPTRDLVVFPEGGIRHDGLGPFKSGAFRVAVATGAPVVPVTLVGTAGVVTSALVPSRGVVTVDIAAPIAAPSDVTLDHRALRHHARAVIERTLAAS